MRRCSTARGGRPIASPGVSLREPFLQQAVERGIDVIGDVELFACEARAPIAAITGTNGKSTVTSLVAHMAEVAGKRVLAGGNLGRPALDLLEEATPDLYVVELSSFQLDTTRSLRTAAATVPNVRRTTSIDRTRLRNTPQPKLAFSAAARPLSSTLTTSQCAPWPTERAASWASACTQTRPQISSPCGKATTSHSCAAARKWGQSPFLQQKRGLSPFPRGASRADVGAQDRRAAQRRERPRCACDGRCAGAAPRALRRCAALLHRFTASLAMGGRRRRRALCR